MNGAARESEKALEREFTVRRELGLHARPAGEFVRLSGRFRCDIQVGRGPEWVSGRSVLSLLSLAAGKGTRLKVRAVGEDAEAALDALGRVLEDPGDAGSADAGGAPEPEPPARAPDGGGIPGR